MLSSSACCRPGHRCNRQLCMLAGSPVLLSRFVLHVVHDCQAGSALRLVHLGQAIIEQLQLCHGGFLASILQGSSTLQQIRACWSKEN